MRQQRLWSDWVDAQADLSLRWSQKSFCWFLYPATKKWRGIILYPPKRFEYPSVRPSVCLSALRFGTLNLSSFWAIFLKLCVDIDIGEEWFRLINGLNSFINNRVMALDWCKKSVVPHYLQNKWTWWILIKFHICIDIYKIHVVSDARYFWSIVNRVMALDRRQNFVYAQCLVN